MIAMYRNTFRISEFSLSLWPFLLASKLIFQQFQTSKCMQYSITTCTPSVITKPWHWRNENHGALCVKHAERVTTSNQSILCFNQGAATLAPCFNNCDLMPFYAECLFPFISNNDARPWNTDSLRLNLLQEFSKESNST